MPMASWFVAACEGAVTGRRKRRGDAEAAALLEAEAGEGDEAVPPRPSPGELAVDVPLLPLSPPNRGAKDSEARAESEEELLPPPAEAELRAGVDDAEPEPAPDAAAAAVGVLDPPAPPPPALPPSTATKSGTRNTSARGGLRCRSSTMARRQGSAC